METKGLTLAESPGGGIPRGLSLKVCVVAGPDEGREAPLDGTIDIGADPSCTLPLTDPSVSRKHVSVGVTAGKIVVRDLGSRNGTIWMGAKIKEAEVPLGTVLAIGKSQLSIVPRWHVREVAPSARRSFGKLVGESVAMREAFAILERVAPADVTVLIEGESGTGKELAARGVHDLSSREKGPYVVFDCGSVPADLAESELFGHKRGAFSGATADRLGAFQSADGGTLFLDELGELPLELQPKLLRALETGEVRPVGEDKSRKVNVRIVAATNRDLHAEVHRGRFRGDLLYRLEVVRVRMPPLRSRPEDMVPIATRLFEGHLPEDDRIEGENLQRLMAYGWPGNVRELRNTLLRAVTLAGKGAVFSKLVFNLGPGGHQEPATLGMELPGVSSPMLYKEAKARLLLHFERAYVASLMERHDDNVQRAAEAAGLSRKHLYELLKRVDEGRSEG